MGIGGPEENHQGGDNLLKVKLSLGILALALAPLAAPLLARSHPLFALLIRSFSLACATRTRRGVLGSKVRRLRFAYAVSASIAGRRSRPCLAWSRLTAGDYWRCRCCLICSTLPPLPFTGMAICRTAFFFGVLLGVGAGVVLLSPLSLGGGSLSRKEVRTPQKIETT